MMEVAQTIVDQVLEEVQTTEGPGVENPLGVAEQALQETLAASVIPSEYWSEIVSWISSTGLDIVYLDSHDRIGAWWAAKEVRSMGYTLNFTKSGKVPSEWFPDGAHWEEAEAEARYRLVASWESLVLNGALEKDESL
ncbi:hypothetical protein [Veillonella sp. CHU740]|uniref:hypothetical protein n=1 Tax=Veillonella sp. CHU740 TaxID=2490950 RepID=UPI000F8EE38F|nr:hypothetical protein [Veillonella sp. CHU740]